MSDKKEIRWLVPLRLDFDGGSHVVRPDLPDSVDTWRRVRQVSGMLWEIETRATPGGPGRDLSDDEVAALRARGAVPAKEGDTGATPRIRIDSSVTFVARRA